MTEVIKTQAVVIGGGPGGYVAAIRLGQLGKKCVLVERDNVGGVCLNWGCIPSKALIHIAKLYEEIQHGAEFGIEVTGVKLNMEKVQSFKRGAVKKLTGGIEQLAKTAGVKVVYGTAQFETRNSISVETREGKTLIVEFEQAVVAAGSRPIEIPGFAIDGTNVVDSKDALDWVDIPARMVVIGGGVIGLEMGMLYQKFGSKVTVVEATPQLLPGTDKEIAQTLERICKRQKIGVHLSSKALEYQKTATGLAVKISTPTGPQTIECDKILLAVGRRPDGTKLGLEKLGVEVKGHIPVNKKLQTNVPHIYAIGDVAGPPLLAHKASKEGLVAAEVIAGHKIEYDVLAMPGAIFTDPEVATVGLSEDDARAKGLKTYTGKFPFAASGRAVSTGFPEGFVKIVAEEKTDRVLGVHMIGHGVSELLGEATLAIEMGACVEDIALTVHAHPTMSESIMEAAEASLGKAIHMVNKNVAGAH